MAGPCVWSRCLCLARSSMKGTGFRPATLTSTLLTASSWSLPTPMPTTNRRSPPCRDCFRRIEWLASPVPIWSGASGRFTVSHNSNRLPIADWGLRIADYRKNETTLAPFPGSFPFIHVLILSSVHFPRPCPGCKPPQPGGHRRREGEPGGGQYYFCPGGRAGGQPVLRRRPFL